MGGLTPNINLEFLKGLKNRLENHMSLTLGHSHSAQHPVKLSIVIPNINSLLFSVQLYIRQAQTC